MAIEQMQDGLLSFNIPIDENNQNITLPKFEEYLNYLNVPELADCVINKLGMLTDKTFNGSFTQSKPDKFRVIIGSEFNPIIYRGQNNDYPFMSSSKRYELFDGNERVRHSIEWIKKQEFIRLISITPYIKRAKEFKVLDYTYDIDTEAIAKHYNLTSDYLDVTRDLMTALFFAYTYYNSEQGKVLPLPAFDYNTPYLYVGDIKELYDKAQDSVMDIGFQPVPRAKAQKAMSINVSGNFDYIKSLFKKIELPKNPAIAKYVYNKFEEGRLLFPEDYATECANQVKESKILQNDLFIKYCEETKTDDVWLKGEYKKLGYQLISYSYEISEQARQRADKEVDEHIIPFLDNGFIFRGIKKSQNNY